MSEKNVQGAQWTKSTTHKLNYDAAFGAVAGLTGGLPASIYGGVAAAGIADIPPQPPDGLQQQHSYANVRFQPPSIHHHVTAPPPPPPSTPSTPTPTPTSVLLPLGAISSNVPAPSGGFVPPPFIAAGVGVANVQPSNATSVLTPNPFAVHSAAGSNANFGLEQFQHLNPQQQYEFTKMMTAMNSAAAAASLATSTVVTTTTSLNNLGTTTAMMTSQQQTAGVRHHVVEVSSSSGAITSSIAENVMNVINVSTMAHSSSSSSSSHGRSGFGVKVPDEEKMRRIQHVVETGIGDQAKQQIMHILDCIATLKPVEKLLLYLRMPGEAPETDPLRHPQNPLGTRSEINHTINWVRSHLEHDPQVSIPKQDVYNDYIAYCERLSIKPLSTADFGKVMKQVFPEIRPRRLGTRGHSRYCYAAMRKTTKLTPPQLPQLSNNISSKLSACEGGSSNTITFGTADDCSESSWNVIKLWAESMLNIKVEDMKGLANHIQNNNLIAMGASLINQKKAAQREPKDKRALGDMGPLKKRRKKKRKGSSSSESSCNQSIQQRSDSTTNKSSNPSEPSMSLASDDEKKPLQLLEVKQEIMDSPSYQRVKSLTSPKLQAAAVSNFRDSTKPPPYEYKKPHCANPLVQQQQQQQQILPMNLATEPRTVLTRAPASSGLVNVAASTAVKNLTPKIMDLSSAAAAGASSFNVGPEQVPIKEEVVDDYNTTTVFCKKVLKAQQTKGFWANSPTSGGINNSGGVPATTITAASPPLSVIATTSAASVASAAELDAAQATNYLMGPPAQITTSTSPSASSTAALPMEANAATQQPKVSSRNMLQLRAKKLRYYQIREAMANNASAAGDSHHAADGSTTDIDKDADLPENLGLPRERVISICNMDKHELDDYFLPGEEENSQDQEAELLQYFQTGDAEEKQNSLDANKTSNPTASNLPPALTHESNNNNNNNNNVVMNNNKSRHAPNSYRPVGVQMSTTNKVLQSKELGQAKIAYEGGVVSAAAVAGRNTPVNSSAYAVGQRQATAAAVSATSQTPAVGSASASLALMSQKHQQQQQQNQQQQQQQQQLPNKRKISLNTMAISKINKTTARKNCIFFPISPNINSVGTSSGGTASHSASNGSVSLFASPGVTRQFRPRPAGISKQHSLDFETSSNSDPMIGACRRRKSIYSSGGGGGGSQSIGYGSTTSASAPPSPSLAQQQQKQQQQLLHSHLFNLQQPVSSGNQWQLNSAVAVVAYNDLSSQAASLLADQNSLDLDLFDAAGGGARGANAFDHDSLLDAAAEVAVADCVLSSLTETQRSQSVPLSQLQRNLSPAFNRSFQTNFSTCTSVAQTPVPDEFADFNLFSENSQHGAQSMAQVNKQQSREIKLEDAADVLTSDTTGMLDEVDVSEILSSPDFVAKFSSEVHLTSNVAATATCSSAGSSSGYSSGACTTFGSGGGGGGGGGSGGGSAGGGGGGALAYSFGSGIVSRSVPSTPLPHQQQYLFGASNFYDRQRTIDEIHLSPTAVSTAAGGNASSSIFSSAASSINAAKYSNSHSQQFSRNAYDISKSMPTTPITTPCFRYSPAEFHRDFLINGNTIDSISSLPSMNVLGGGTDSFMKDDDGMTALNSDSLMDESGTVTPETFTVAADDVGGTAMVGSDILDSL